MNKNKTLILELPVAIGATAYDLDFPEYPLVVIGYRVGRMMGEDEEEFEEEHGKKELYVEYSGCGMEMSVPISEIGKSIFFTQEEAKSAANNRNSGG